ncbi:hypothetical protein K8R47_03450 [archaeon]|nr:hypothetical protein [archaeon]
MDIQFKKGYNLYRTANVDPMIVAPHSGPAMENSNTRDDNSETIANLIWNKTKGTLIISNMPRHRIYGVDFNRDVPKLKDAIKYYPIFKNPDNSKDQDKLFNFRKKYGFVAKNEEQYDEKLRIYQNFWGEVSKGNIIIMMHSSFIRMKSLPSVVDFVTFGELGIKKSKIKKILEEINTKYYKFFKGVDLGYKQMTFFETQRMVARIINMYKSFNLKDMTKEMQSIIKSDMTKISQYATPYLIKRLKQSFTPQNYLTTVKSALDNCPLPQVTVENAFDASLAHGPKRKLFPTKNKTIIEIETSRFMSYFYPNMTAQIMKDIIEKVKD